ncbi:MAG TPA: amino acid adenylation domain-containing protein [Bryobacteraceae bacterium]|jgi:amino acid adenylation domain-containing protein
MPPQQARSAYQASVLENIEEYATRTPHAVAVEFEDVQLTYRELSIQSDRIAGKLKRSGIGREAVIAVCLNRSIPFVVAVVGILKAGAAYLPIDPFIPEKRLQYMLDDSRASLVITSLEFAARLNGRGALTVESLLESDHPARESDLRAPEPDDLAYIIYTSGSTGRPKGVEICHRGLSLCLQAVRHELATGPEDTVLAVTSPSFDVSVMEMFVSLDSGARLVILPQNRLLSPDLLAATISKHCPTIIFGTPALWRLLLESGWKGDPRLRAVTGGESLDRHLAERMLQATGSFWNHYGPTEATIVATSYRVNADDLPSPIGHPMPYIHAFVVGEDGRPVSPGEQGELLIGGESLARGYRNHPELTAERFINYAVEPGRTERVYRTGDLVRQRADGAFEFAGRIDNQVKIRGYRIELEEIENTLSEHPDILEAAVVLHQDASEDKLLVAYFRTSAGRQVSTEDLRAFLFARLPVYMTPARFVKVSVLPLTPNGKVDRLELSRREIAPEAGSSSVANIEDPVSLALLAIWRRVLKLENIGVDDNFFDLGGHSLLAAKMFEEIERRFRKQLPLSTLFEAATVSSLAKVISSSELPEWSPLVRIRGGDGAPFFCVHPIGGNVLTFKNLSAHMTNRPFYGLQARGLSHDEYPHTSIDDMADDYLKYVRQIQQSGPYFLGGYSAGGLVAFEMARLLQQSGEKVDLIVLFDSYLHPQSLPQPAPDTGAYPAGLKRPLGAIQRRLIQMKAVAPDKRAGIVARDLARLSATIKLKLYGRTRNWRWNPVRLDAVSAFLFAIRNYRPRPLNARVTLFVADVNAPASAKNLPAVWQALVTGRLDVHHLATDHDRLLEAPFAAELAHSIEGQIEECLAASHSPQHRDI